jgi:hypothetical protein
MMWGNIQENLKKALTVTISFPAGTVWLPDHPLTIDEWLTAIAQTDEELRDLNIPRMRFLQNHWPIITLAELEWGDEFSNRRAVLAMYVAQRAYILFSNWNEYQVVAAIEPKNKPALYRAVIAKLLENRSFVPKRPTHVRNRRPDLVPELVPFSYQDLDRRMTRASGDENFSGIGRPTDWMHRDLKRDAGWNGFLSDIFVGWIGKWLNIPELGFWHEDLPESIGRKEKGGSKFSCDTDTNQHMEINSDKLKSGEKTGRLEGRKALGR